MCSAIMTPQGDLERKYNSVKKDLIGNLRCPNCFGGVEISTIAQSTQVAIVEGSLLCNKCNSLYEISEGIPILLPREFSNVAECEQRKAVSEKAGERIDTWGSFYDISHFGKLSHIRIRQQLQKIGTTLKPKVLDIGIGWGVNYLPFNRNIDLFGLDFSYESLLLLRRIYERSGESSPNLLCASLSAIPLKNIKFDLIWSTQVYQHIPDAKEIESSFDYVIRHLLKRGCLFVVDNLNYNYLYRRFLVTMKNILKSTTRREADLARYYDGLYTKYYTKKDFQELVGKFQADVTYEISYTENLFHPEFRLTPRSSFIAFADVLIQKTPFAKLLGRQISLMLEKR